MKKDTLAIVVAIVVAFATFAGFVKESAAFDAQCAATPTATDCAE